MGKFVIVFLKFEFNIKPAKPSPIFVWTNSTKQKNQKKIAPMGQYYFLFFLYGVP